MYEDLKAEMRKLQENDELNTIYYDFSDSKVIERLWQEYTKRDYIKEILEKDRNDNDDFLANFYSDGLNDGFFLGFAMAKRLNKLVNN